MADDIEDDDYLLSQLTAEEIAELSEIIDPDVNHLGSLFHFLYPFL